MIDMVPEREVKHITTEAELIAVFGQPRALIPPDPKQMWMVRTDGSPVVFEGEERGCVDVE